MNARCNGSGLRCPECGRTPCLCFEAEIDYPEISKPYWGGPAARRGPPWGARIQIVALAILAAWLVYCLWYAGVF
jgi:hypothetical protein